MAQTRWTIRGSRIAVVGVTAAILAGAGCGGDGDSEQITVEAGPLSKKGFVARAELLCQETKADFQAAFNTYVEENSNATATEAGRRKLIEELFVPRYRDLIEEMARIGAPSDMRAPVSSFLESLSTRIDEVAETPRVAFENLEPFAKAARLAREAGLTECAATLG